MAETYIAELGYRVDTSPLKKGERALDDVAKAGDRADSTASRLTSTVGVLSAGIAALAANTVITDVINYSDSWARVDNQLRLVITSETELIDKRQKLIQLSKETNANLGSTVALYAELYRNTRELGTSETEVLNVTRTLNNLFVSGGKDAQTQAGAIRQLSQALGAGALRGDEFNSVAEAAPRILDAISQSTGMAKGELREFAATGGITAAILVDAINSYSSEAQRLADSTTKTFEQSVENAKTNALAYVGSSQSMKDATQALGNIIETASENIGSIVSAVGAAAGVLMLSAVPAVIAYTASIYNNIKAQLLANTQAVITRNAYGQIATTAATATVATNALSMATRLLLSPWGLIGAAVAAAITVFSLAKSESDDLKEAMEKQAGAVEDLEKKYQRMTKAQIGATSVAARKELIDIQMQRRDAMRRLGEAYAIPAEKGGAAMVTMVQNEIKSLDEQAKATTATIETLNKSFTGGLPTEWVEPFDPESIASNDQIKALQDMQKEIGMTADELFVYRQQQKSIANGDAPEMTAAIVKQAEAFVAQRAAAKKAADELEETKKKEKEAFKDLISGTDTVDLNALQQSKDYDTWLDSISTTSTQMQALRDEIIKTQEAINAGDLDPDIGKEYIDGLNSQLDRLDVSPFDAISSSTKDGLSSIQSLSKQGSKEYQKLGVAIQAVNAIQAVAAVLNQAGGDPYTAFARMAAMAASVASLGYSVGGLSGGFDDLAAERQETQGTTVWGDKSESIANGIDIIASATESLVGINTNMLKALTSVQNGIAKATSIIGRDITTPTASVNVRENLFEGFQNFFSGDILNLTSILGDTFTELLNLPLNILGNWLGGSSKVVDQGIRILGGQLGEMIDDITVQSYQTVQYKKWKYGKKKSKTAYKDITDDVGAQFQLVLDSIADSVFEGATMLGLNAKEVEKAIQEFELETIRISLKGLDAEEQKAEIEAVFGKVFDDIAVGIVPFIGDFQKVGEGLGETLARVATQVNIMDIMVERLGVTIFDKFSDPEAYATAADNISELVGGIEAFAEKTSGFIDNFATDATKLDIYQDSLRESLGAVGLALPGTSAGMWDLMASLDASTEAGQEQIAVLLNNQETAAAYYDMLEKITGRYRDAIDAMYDVSEATAQMTLDAALAAARMGDLSLAEELDVGSLAPDMANYGSRLEYELARAETAAKLEELAKITEGTISVDEKQLETLEQIRDAVEKTNVANSSEGIDIVAAQVSSLKEMQKQNNRMAADSNALLQQMVIDGIPVRIES